MLLIWIYRRGTREALRRELRSAQTYPEWVSSAKALDEYLGIDSWKESDDFAYYDYVTIRKVVEDMKELLRHAKTEQDHSNSGKDGVTRKETQTSGGSADQLRLLLQACTKSNFGGIESARLYSQTYHGTKDLLQEFYEECKSCEPHV